MAKKQKQEEKKVESEQQDQVKPSQAVVSLEEFEKLKVDFENLQNQLKRAVADYQNLEKRVAEGRSEFTSWATTELVKKLLGVMSHFDMALSGATEQDRLSGWFKGVELAVGQLRQVLRDEGLEQIETDGQFDPALHEAVDTRDGENDKILEVVERGYKLNGKIIKPARVVVGRKEMSS